MAPYTGEPARATQSKAKKPTPIVPRIVPAIPLALSRTPRANGPTTLEESVSASASPDDAEATTTTGAKGLAEERHLVQVQAPLTPESKASALSYDERAADTPRSSPSRASGVNDGQIQHTRAASVKQTEVGLNCSPIAPEPARGPIKELPPPFYPADHTSTPISETSSLAPSFKPATNNSIIHHPRPSTGSIVFGGFQDSSNTSPAPPLGMAGYPAPPPGFVAGNYGPPPFFTPSHSHHPSDPNGHMMYPPPMTMGPLVAHGYRRDSPHQAGMTQNQPWYPYASPAPYQKMHQESYIPRQGSTPLPNVTTQSSRPVSQTSTKTQEGDIKHMPEASGTARFAKVQNGIHRTVTYPEAESYSNELIDYMFSRFGNPEFADRVLDVGSPGKAPFVSIPVHQVIVARSKTLELALSAPTDTYRDGLKVTQLLVEDPFITAQAVMEALKFLYGAPLPLPAKFLQGMQAFDNRAEQVDASGISRQRTDQALGFAAAGVFLQLPAVAHRGIDIALHILRWDNIERALEFALLGGLSPSWIDAQSAPSSPTYPLYDPYSSILLRGILAFISLGFPFDFQLNNAAPQLSGSPFMSSFVESRPPTHHPRLSMIRFGEIPVEDTARPTFATTILSSILLSLPFLVLRSLFDNAALGGKLGWPVLVDIMKAVVEEREIRRIKALKSLNKGAFCSEADQQLLENLSWEERVQPSDRAESGYFLARFSAKEAA